MTDRVQQLIEIKDPPERRIRIVEDVEKEEGKRQQEGERDFMTKNLGGR